MGLFDGLQNIINGVSDMAQNTVGDVVGGITENPVLQEIQEQTGTVTEGLSSSVSSATEQGQNVVDDITQNLGL